MTLTEHLLQPLSVDSQLQTAQTATMLNSKVAGNGHIAECLHIGCVLLKGVKFKRAIERV